MAKINHLQLIILRRSIETMCVSEFCGTNDAFAPGTPNGFLKMSWCRQDAIAF
jgi:hypothetical protein